MENNFKNEDFEQFLRQSADGLRMRPSEKVWKGISANLNQRRRRFGFFLGISLLATSALGYYLLEPTQANNSSSELAQLNKSHQTNIPNKANSQDSKAINSNPVISASAVASNSTQVLNRRATRSSNNNDITDYLLGLEKTTTQSNDVPDAVTPENEFTPTIIDSYPGSQTSTEVAVKNDNKQENVDPLTIESVTNSYAPKIRRGKVGLQLFFTPTVSYRQLRENKTYTGGMFNGVNDFNSAVNHKPDFGLQVGILAKYPVAPKMKLRGGLQFNVNRYDIKTYNSSYEVGTIRFNNRQSVAAMTGYNNFTGYKSDWLENLYLSVSAPVGLEYKLGGNEKTNFGVATSIQPTYVIGDKAYLITSDYKNYLEVPWLVRKWNVSTGFEAYVNYSTGQIKWQVGPQVRYQLLSSFDGEYPVKEHLYDFGLRVGVSLNNR